MSQEIDNAPTTTTLVNNTGSAVWGQSVSLTATVSSAGGVPTGSIDFKDGVNLLHNVPLDGSGTASYSTSSLAVGSHTLSATYVPADASFLTSSDSLATRTSARRIQTLRSRQSVVTPSRGSHTTSR